MKYFFVIFGFTFFCLLEAKKSSALQEYKEFVPRDVYKKLLAIYNNKKLLVIDKLKELDEVFMTLPEETLDQLPTPKAFRRLPVNIQHKINRIYYSKLLDFEEKLRRLEEMIQTLPKDQLKLIPMQSEKLPGLVEFDVPVLLQFNGQFETNLLKDYLPPKDFELLTKILTKPNMPEVTKARLVGKLLKDAYQKSPNNFPLPLGDEDPEVPMEIRRLGIHLMFSRNPFDNIDPFSKALKLLKGGIFSPQPSIPTTKSTPKTPKHFEDEDEWTSEFEDSLILNAFRDFVIEDKQQKLLMNNNDDNRWINIHDFVRKWANKIHV